MIVVPAPHTLFRRVRVSEVIDNMVDIPYNAVTMGGVCDG